MKKSLSFLLSIIMFLTMLPMDVTAAEQQRSSRDDLLTLACNIFPEYADTINGNGAAPANISPIENDTVIFSETREISDTQALTYTQYASGRSVIVNQNASVFEWDYTDQPADFSAGTRWTFSFEVAMSDSAPGSSDCPGVFYLDNVEVTIYNSGYDRITNDGSAYVNNSNYCVYNKSSNGRVETSSSSAHLRYSITFIPTGNYGVPNSNCPATSLYITAGNNDYAIWLN